MMKKTLFMSTVLIALILLTTSVFAANSTLADTIYSKGKDYGVEESDRVQMERYFINHPTTEDENKYILGKADEVLAILDAAKTKDVRDLSQADRDKVQALVQDAANHIGLSINNVKIDSKGTITFNVVKNSSGKVITVVHKKLNKSDSSSNSGKKFANTGSDATLAIISLGVVAVSIVIATRLRKNA